MLAELGGGTMVPGCSFATAPVAPVSIAMAADYPDRVAGRGLRAGHGGRPAARGRLHGAVDRDPGRQHEYGCGRRHRRDVEQLLRLPPSWRPDLTDPADLAEEVIRLEGYENIPVRAAARLGRARPDRAGSGCAGRSAGRWPTPGYVEVISSPFASARGLRPAAAAGRRRRGATRWPLANPLSDDEPLMRTTLLPGLLRVLARNIGRGFADVALFETGPGLPAAAGRPAAWRRSCAVDRAPTAGRAARAGGRAARSAAARRPRSWPATASRPAGGATAGRPAGRTRSRRPGWCCAPAGSSFEVRADQHEPWHPGRCAAIFVPPASERPASGWPGTPASCTRG